jgi:hypothetical protein
MMDGDRIGRPRGLEHLLDEGDPAARTVLLGVQQLVGRAHSDTEAIPDAGFDAIAAGAACLVHGR